MADNIQTNESIINTSFKFSDIERLKSLVNEKKHDCLIAIESNENQETLVEHDGIKIVLPKQEQDGSYIFYVAADSDISNVSEYRLEAIDEEIAMFCMFATKSTKLLIEETYSTLF